VAMGRPETVARVESSHTGRWLRGVLAPAPGASARGAERRESRAAAGR
jgi:hypothetical protein